LHPCGHETELLLDKT